MTNIVFPSGSGMATIQSMSRLHGSSRTKTMKTGGTFTKIPTIRILK